MSELQVVVFSLNGQTFGVESSQVFQIVKYQVVTKVPGMPGFAEGIFEYRKANLPVISLNRRFSLGEDEVGKKSKIILVRIDNMHVGFIVNDVIEIRKFTDDEISPFPAMIKSEAAAFINKVGKMNEEVVSIIDLRCVLEDSEIDRLAEKMEQYAKV